MSKPSMQGQSAADLRARAVTKLVGPVDPRAAHRGAAEAFRVLHDMVWSPDTASDALALLHELQVHQVELELQAEEMGAIRAELEATLDREARLRDAAPAGCLTVDRAGLVREANVAAGLLLGEDRDALAGRSLPAFLVAESAQRLLGLVDLVAAGRLGRSCTLQLAHRDGADRRVHAAVAPHPDGGAFLVVLLAADGDEAAPAH